MYKNSFGSRLQTALLITICLLATSCENDFYLSENEAAAFAYSLKTQSNAHLYYDLPLNQPLTINFQPNSSPPQISSTNLLQMMRATNLVSLENNGNVRLDRISGELEKQVGGWVNERLRLYSDENNSDVRLTAMDQVVIAFLNTPAFTFAPDRQAIAFDLTVRVTINATIHVNAVNPLINFFVGVNGTYPLQVVVNNYRLQGEAVVVSPYANAGSVRFQLTPQPGAIDIFDRGTVVSPAQIKNGARDLLGQQLRSPVDVTFNQQYDHFALTGLSLSASNGTTPATLFVNYLPRPEKARPALHVVTRASDKKLYHARKTGGGWTDHAGPLFPTVNANFTSDPTLVASSQHQLELVATTSIGELFYAQWGDGTWGNPLLIAPSGSGSSFYYRNKPAVVASAPGQLEVIVERADNRLVHLRRVNGIWQAPVVLNLPPNLGGATNFFYHYTRPAAVQAGNKIFLLSFRNYVNSNYDLIGMVFDMETAVWGTHAALVGTEQVNHAPALVASGDLRVELAYVGRTSGNVYHRGATLTSNNIVAGNPITGFSLGTEINAGGVVNTSPVLLASGFRQLELIGRGTDNKLYHNHYVGPNSPLGVNDGQMVNIGWQGWNGMDQQYFGTFIPARIENFAAAATRAGKIEVASRVMRTTFFGTTYPVYHNAYDADLYGRKPWKAIGWRGYQMTRSQSFAGQPAIAALDQNTEVAFVGSGVTVRQSPMGESNTANFADISSVVLANSPTMSVQPVVISTGTGLVDLFAVATDGKIRHLRSKNGSWSAPTILQVTGTNFTFARPPAVTAYGNGQLDVVAVATNNNIYHWRLKGGVWSGWTQLAGTSASAPSLTYTGGSGQLEMLAVRTDNKLNRWRYLHPNWVNPIQLPGSFSIIASLFGQQSVSSWGDGSVDAIVVQSGTGAVNHRRVGPRDDTVPGGAFGPPVRNFALVGGVVSDIPVLTAFGPTRLHIMARGSDNAWYNNLSKLYIPPIPGPIVPGADPLISWGGFKGIGGSGLIVGGVANLGSTNMVAIAENLNGQAFTNRYNGAIWTGFQPVIGQTADMQLLQPFFRPAIASRGN